MKRKAGDGQCSIGELPRLRRAEVERRLDKIRVEVFALCRDSRRPGRQEVSEICARGNRAFACGMKRSEVEKEPLVASMLEFADVVALSFLLPRFQGKKAVLHVSIPEDFKDMARMAVATSMMIDSLPNNSWIESLEVHLVAMTHGVRDPWKHRSLWARMFTSIKRLLRCNVAMRHLLIRCPASLASKNLGGDLNSIARVSTEEIRRAVLMGTHHSVGAKSILSSMPSPLVAIILNQAAPKTPCRIVLEVIEESSQPAHQGSDLDYIANWVG